MEKSCYYAALTKARAMYGKRLNAEQYAGLLRCASVTEIAEYLRSQTEYGVYLEALPQTGVHRGQLENLLRRSLTDRMMKLERFDRKDGVCVYHMMRQEIAAIVSAANAVLTGDMTRMIAGLPLYMERRASFSIESLGEVQTREDLEVVLLNTRYAQAWKKACGSGGVNPGRLELLMLNDYYEGMHAFAKKLGKSGRQLADIVDAEINIQNFALIYRLKVFFGYSADRILPRLLTASRSYNLESLQKIAQEYDKEKLLRLFTGLLGQEEDVVSDEYLEGLGRRAIDKKCRHNLAFSSSSSVALYCYMRLTSNEIEDMITIIEGVRYQVEAKDLKPLLFTAEARRAVG